MRLLRVEFQFHNQHLCQNNWPDPTEYFGPAQGMRGRLVDHLQLAIGFGGTVHTQTLQQTAIFLRLRVAGRQ